MKTKVQDLPREFTQGRRRFLKNTLSLSAGVAATAAVPGFWIPGSRAASVDTSRVVETNHGKIRGSVKRNLNVFKGIPYGASTAGENRFRPPQAPTSWTGIRDTVAYGSTAPPKHSLPMAKCPTATARIAWC